MYFLFPAASKGSPDVTDADQMSHGSVDSSGEINCEGQSHSTEDTADNEHNAGTKAKVLNDQQIWFQ